MNKEIEMYKQIIRDKDKEILYFKIGVAIGTIITTYLLTN